MIYTLRMLKGKYSLDAIIGIPADMSETTEIIPAPDAIFREDERLLLDRARNRATELGLFPILQARMLLGTGTRTRRAIIVVAASADRRDLIVIDASALDESLFAAFQGQAAVDAAAFGPLNGPAN